MKTQVNTHKQVTRSVFPLLWRGVGGGLLLFITLLSSCKKDTEANIDYNVLTEQRILEISEQATISDEDIATLERLNAQVTDNSLKAKYTQMIEGVKIIKDFIPLFNQLRIDPDVIFQDLYAELEDMLKQVTDDLPRKATLQTELETALANYNTEEVEFLEVVLAAEGGDLARFLANNFNIQPVEGKPARYLRADIERVDSLVFNAKSEYDEGVHYQTLRHFRGLKYLKTSSFKDNLQDLNHMSNLETLEISLTSSSSWELKIDQLQNLKHLIVTGSGTVYSPFGEVIDFTDKYPLLERLELPGVVTKNLTTLLLPDKQHLTKLVLEGYYYFSLPKIKRLVVEGKEIGPRADFALGSADNLEIEEVRLSGFGGPAADEWNPTSLYVGRESRNTDKVKIKKLSLKDINTSACIFVSMDIEELSLENVHFGDVPETHEYYGSGLLICEVTNVDFPQKPDFNWLNIKEIDQFIFENNSYNGIPFSVTDISPLLDDLNTENLEYLYLAGLPNYPNKTLDLGRFKKLLRLRVTTATATGGQLLEKVIINKAMEGRFRVVHRNEAGVTEPTVQIEYVN